MTKRTFQRIGVVANLNKKGVDALVTRFVPDLVKAGFDISIEPCMASLFKDRFDEGITDACDLITAFGGDGTILRTARDYEGIPILGVKGGRVGFLTEPLTPNLVARIEAGRLQIQKRMRITASVMSDDKTIQEFTALNDVVVHGAGYSRMVTLRAEVGGSLKRELSADGVIIATPTGSTAYSLSAGGPLLAPTIEAILLNPLCPHTLSDRPVVLDAGETVIVTVLSPQSEIRVTVDGQQGCDLEVDQKVVIKKSPKPTHLVVPDKYDFFSLLQEKL